MSFVVEVVTWGFWGILLVFLLFCPNPLASCDCLIGGFSDISDFCPNLLFVQFFRFGAFACFSTVLSQPACFLRLPHWGIFPYFRFLPQSTLCSILPVWSICLFFCCFTPTSLLPVTALLGDFPVFQVFAPTSLLPVTALLGDFSVFQVFAPIHSLFNSSGFALVNKFWTRNIKK